MKWQRLMGASAAAIGLLGASLLLEVITGFGVLGGWALGQKGFGPFPRGTEPQATAPEGRLPEVRLPRDRNAERKLEEAKRLIREQEWRQAIDLLQGMLDEKEDKFTQDDKGRWASVRSEVNRMLSSMGPEGLRHYEQYYGAQAKALLQQAMQAGDLHKLAEVSVRYLYTEAGAEALAALGTVQLDQGSPIMAALFFERLIKRVADLQQLPTLTLVKAAFAFERAGQTELRDQVWQELPRRNWQGDLPENLARLTPEQLRQLAAAGSSSFTPWERSDWPMFGGDMRHTAFSEGTAPFTEKVYEFPTYRDPRTRDAIGKAKNALERRGVVLPGAMPASSGDLVLFRTSYGLVAIRAATGEQLWQSAQYDYNLDVLVSPSRGVPPDLQNWARMYDAGGQRAFCYNTLLGTLSLDRERAYIVEDVPLPPIVARRNRPGIFIPVGPPVSASWVTNGNNLAAVRLDGGRLAWLIEGGKSNTNSPLAETFFLGPPLPLGGKLFVLAEANGEIRLVCLEPSTGAVQWLQPLCIVERRMSDEPERRMEACHLAYSDGILVCPTNAGIVLGFDLLSRSLVWAQPYESAVSVHDDGFRRPGPMPWGLQEPNWYYSAPMIAEGKVVFTAPDTKKLYCLELKDGKNAWGPIPKEAGDLYVAGIYYGRILIVGRDRVRAINLTDGSPVWSVSVPTPAGRGTANATAYFLPTRSGEVLAISLQDGVILGTSQSAKKEPLGNLLFHRGYVFVQDSTSLTAYPQLAARQAEIAKALEKNPNDPVALVERGVFQLHWGKLEAAVADLRQALKQEISYDLRRRAQKKLFEALTILLSRDFSAYESWLAEYEQLINIPVPASGENTEEGEARLAEEKQRRATFLRLLARGRESQGRFREAFQVYLEFGRLGGSYYLNLPGDSSTQVPPERYAEARLAELLQRPMPEPQRREILDLVEREWQRVQSSSNVDELQQFVTLLGETGETGLRARLLLAERLVGQGDFVKAEQHLLLLTAHENPQVAARGLESLARLHARTGNMETAIFYYMELAERYPNVPVRDGKTGRQILDELTTDKRYLPFLDSGNQTWLPTRSEISSRVESGSFPQLLQFHLEFSAVKGFAPQRYSLAIVSNQFPHQLRIYERGQDQEMGREIRTLPLEQRNVSFSFNGGANWRKGLRCQGVGSFVYFVWGTHLYALDLTRKNFAWKYDLSGGILDSWPPNMPPHVFWDPALGDWTVNLPDGTRGRLYTHFVANSQYVAFYVVERGLVVVEARTGRVLWERRLASPPAELFGSERVVCLVMTKANDPRGASQGLVLAARTGEVISVPDFLPAWQQSQHKVGHCLLLCEHQPNNCEIWRLYDVVTGRNVWSRRLHNVLSQPESLVPNTLARVVLAPREDGDQANAGELVPHLVVLDTHTGQNLVLAQVPDDAVLPQSEAYVLADGFHWYLIYNKHKRPNAGGMLVLGNGRQIFMQAAYMSTLFVEGPVVAWDRQSGQFRWKTELPPQALIRQRFEELPIIICASWQRVPLDNANRRMMDVSLVHAIDKRNGKVIECETGMRSQFHDLIANRSLGTVMLRAQNFQIVFEVSEPQDRGQTKRSSSNSGQGPAARPEVAKPPPHQVVPIQPIPNVPQGIFPKIQIQPLPVPIVPVQPPGQRVPVPGVPPARPLPPNAIPIQQAPPLDKIQQAKRQLEDEISKTRERLQERIRELHKDGPGIDPQKFEQLRKTIEESHRLQRDIRRELEGLERARIQQNEPGKKQSAPIEPK